MFTEYHQPGYQYGCLQKGSQAQANDLLHPLGKAICVATGDGEHVQAPHSDLDEQDTAPLEVGEEHLDHGVCHQDHAEEDHNGVCADPPVRLYGQIHQRINIHPLQDGGAQLTDSQVGNPGGEGALQGY